MAIFLKKDTILLKLEKDCNKKTRFEYKQLRRCATDRIRLWQTNDGGGDYVVALGGGIYSFDTRGNLIRSQKMLDAITHWRKLNDDVFYWYNYRDVFVWCPKIQPTCCASPLEPTTTSSSLSLLPQMDTIQTTLYCKKIVNLYGSTSIWAKLRGGRSIGCVHGKQAKPRTYLQLWDKDFNVLQEVHYWYNSQRDKILFMGEWQESDDTIYIAEISDEFYSVYCYRWNLKTNALNSVCWLDYEQNAVEEDYDLIYQVMRVDNNRILLFANTRDYSNIRVWEWCKRRTQFKILQLAVVKTLESTTNYAKWFSLNSNLVLCFFDKNRVGLYDSKDLQLLDSIYFDNKKVYELCVNGNSVSVVDQEGNMMIFSVAERFSFFF